MHHMTQLKSNIRTSQQEHYLDIISRFLDIDRNMWCSFAKNNQHSFKTKNNDLVKANQYS